MMHRLSSLLAAFAVAALAESKHPTDEAAIRQRLATYTEARNHSDALCYAADGDFGALGPPSRGRAEIEKALALSAPGYAFSLTVETTRFLDSNVAIVETRAVAGPPEHKIDMLGPTSW